VNVCFCCVSLVYYLPSQVSDIAIFVLKRDVNLHPTNQAKRLARKNVSRMAYFVLNGTIVCAHKSSGMYPHPIAFCAQSWVVNIIMFRSMNSQLQKSQSYSAMWHYILLVELHSKML